MDGTDSDDLIKHPEGFLPAPPGAAPLPPIAADPQQEGGPGGADGADVAQMIRTIRDLEDIEPPVGWQARVEARFAEREDESGEYPLLELDVPEIGGEA